MWVVYTFIQIITLINLIFYFSVYSEASINNTLIILQWKTFTVITVGTIVTTIKDGFIALNTSNVKIKHF